MVDDLFGLALGYRQEPPILGPGLVIDIESQLHFLGETGGIERAHGDPPFRTKPSGDAFELVEVPRYDIGKRDPQCVQVLCLGIAFGDESIRVIGRRVRHANHGRSLKARHQDADVVVHRQAVWAEDPTHAALPQPILGGALQGRKNGLVVYRLEQAKIAGLVAMGLEMKMIDLRTDASDRHPVAPCQPETGLAVIEERVPAPVEQPMHVSTQRRDPVRIIAMKPIGQVDKAVAVAPAAKRGHLDRASCSRVAFRRGGSVRDIWRAGSASAIHQHRSEDAASLEIRPAPNGG